MTAPENPPKLWSHWQKSDDDAKPRLMAFETEEAALDNEACAPMFDGWVSGTQAYVREDVAEAEPRRLAEALASEQRRAQTFMEAWEKAKAERDEWQRLHAVVAQATLGHKARAIEAEKETDAVRRERDALLAERDQLARLGWAAITTIRAMSEIGSAGFFGHLARQAAEDGDMAEGRACNATRMKHLDEADRLDVIVNAVLEDDDEEEAPRG